jgi:hypothetical protein
MKKLALFLCAILAVSTFAPFVAADGVVINPNIRDRWEPVPENSQIAAINYKDGYQKMIISTNFDMQNLDEVIWVFPVPSSPQQVVIDVASEFPQFYGDDVVERSKYNLDQMISVTQLTQIYPAIFFGFTSSIRYAGTMEALKTPEGALGGTIEGVVVWDHVEKEGIAVELLTTKTSAALYNYFRMKGLNIKEGSIDTLNYYIGRDYSFVAAWVSKPQSPYPYYPAESPSMGYYPYGRQPGIMVTFPTEQIFYPLIPTSAYGSTTIPVRIYVLDYVKPELYGPIKSYARTNYYVQSYMNVPFGLENFFGNMPTKNVKYTKIEMSVPSKYFLQDLWFEKGAPMKVWYATGLYSVLSGNGWLVGVLLVLLISAVTGAITGFVFFRNPARFALIGMANIFTIIGLGIVLALTKTKQLDIGLKRRLREEGMIVVSSDTRKIYFLIAFSVLFLIVGLLVGYLIELPLIM